MKEEERDKWATAIAESMVEASEILEGSMKCPCGCDTKLVRRYRDDVMLPVIRKLVVDYMEVKRGLPALVRIMLREGGEKDEGTASGISTSGLN